MKFHIGYVLIILGTLLLTKVMVIIRLSYPEMAETQLFVNFWQEYVWRLLLILMGLKLIEDGRVAE